MFQTICTSHSRLIATIGIIGFSVSSCAFQDPKRVEDDFGNSVRTMIAEQIYDPAVAQTPSPNVPGLLGDAATTSLDTYGAAGRQTRNERTRNAQSAVPISGTASDSGAEE